jgi:TolA-binding protein
MKPTRIVVGTILACLAVSGLAAAQQAFTKPQVADRIRKVEDGVDEFRKWSEKRVEEGRPEAKEGQGSGRARKGGTASESQKEAAREKKDELDDALSDLNGSTNRLRRKFDGTDRWVETKAQVENVLDDARKINQVLARGKYGSQAERYWSVLRANINDLARCYDLKPLGV